MGLKFSWNERKSSKSLTVLLLSYFSGKKWENKQIACLRKHQDVLLKKGNGEMEVLNQPWDKSRSVSIIVPTYNSAKTLRKCLESIKKQSHQDHEIIIVDNESTDNTLKIAEDFGPYGHFYKTQVPVLWVEENGKITKISSPITIRATAEAMAQAVDRPMLLLSAAVDFEQYAAQYGIVADLFAGPMCGRAYFKEAFTADATKDWDSLETSFRKIALSRIQQIKNLARIVSKPWWHRFSWMSDEARALINMDAKPKASDA